MSYDISVTIPPHDPADEEGGRTLSMNWLRNPFGLCTFMEDNVGDGKQSLWHVCNDHSYGTSNDLDRARFLAVVTAYSERLSKLERGFYYFDKGAYEQFALRYRFMRDPKVVRTIVIDGRESFRIDVEAFVGEPDWNRKALQYRQGQERPTVLAWYKGWFAQLVEIAQAMQNPAAVVDIDN